MSKFSVHPHFMVYTHDGQEFDTLDEARQFIKDNPPNADTAVEMLSESKLVEMNYEISEVTPYEPKWRPTKRYKLIETVGCQSF